MKLKLFLVLLSLIFLTFSVPSFAYNDYFHINPVYRVKILNASVTGHITFSKISDASFMLEGSSCCWPKKIGTGLLILDVGLDENNKCNLVIEETKYWGISAELINSSCVGSVKFKDFSYVDHHQYLISLIA